MNFKQGWGKLKNFDSNSTNSDGFLELASKKKKKTSRSKKK